MKHKWNPPNAARKPGESTCLQCGMSRFVSRVERKTPRGRTEVKYGRSYRARDEASWKPGEPGDCHPPVKPKRVPHLIGKPQPGHLWVARPAAEVHPEDPPGYQRCKYCNTERRSAGPKAFRVVGGQWRRAGYGVPPCLHSDSCDMRALRHASADASPSRE